MKKALLIFLMFTMVILSYAEPEVSKKEKIVVLPFKDITAGKYNVGEKISNMISGKLISLGRIEVVDRTELEKLLEEQKLSLSGLVESGQTVEAGKIAGAKLAFTGNVLSLNVYREEEVKKKKTGVLGITLVETEEKVFKKEWIAKISVNMKLIDVETGIASKSIQREYTFITNSVHTEEAAVDGVIEGVSNLLVSETRASFQIKSYIIAKTGNSVIIRLGEDMGLNSGMEFYVYEGSRVIQDKYSGQDIRVGGVYKGLIKITKVDSKSAVARILKGENKISEGDEIREKNFVSISVELSGGIHPFAMNGYAESSKNYSYNYGLFWNGDFTAKLDKQDAKEIAPYVNVNISPAYTDIKPSLDFTVMTNLPMTAFAGTLNLEINKTLFETVDLSASAGIGGVGAIGTVGTVVSSQGGAQESTSSDAEIEKGKGIIAAGGSIYFKGKVKAGIALSDNMTVFGEAGYTYGKIGSWTVETSDKNGKSVSLGALNNKIGELNLTGAHFGAGVKFTF